jgi:heme exporter protein C
MLKIFSPSNVFKLVNWTINFIQSILFPVLLAGLTFALILSPPDYLQSQSVRIMYVHVPAAWISLMIFSLIAMFSLFYYIFKAKNLKLVNKSLAPIGLLFSYLAIVTGSIWGKPTWGTWWAWDARLTSMIVLMLIYLLFVLNFKFVKNDTTSMRVCSFLSILGAVNLFIIKFSVEWWNTLHQASSIKLNGQISIHSSMMTPLMLMLSAFMMYSALIFLMKYKTEIIKMKSKNLNRL